MAVATQAGWKQREGGGMKRREVRWRAEEQSHEQALPGLRRRGIFPPSWNILPSWKCAFALSRKWHSLEPFSRKHNGHRRNEVAIEKRGEAKSGFSCLCLKSENTLKAEVFAGGRNWVTVRDRDCQEEQLVWQNDGQCCCIILLQVHLLLH